MAVSIDYKITQKEGCSSEEFKEHLTKFFTMHFVSDAQVGNFWDPFSAHYEIQSVRSAYTNHEWGRYIDGRRDSIFLLNGKSIHPKSSIRIVKRTDGDYGRGRKLGDPYNPRLEIIVDGKIPQEEKSIMPSRPYFKDEEEKRVFWALVQKNGVRHQQKHIMAPPFNGDPLSYEELYSSIDRMGLAYDAFVKWQKEYRANEHKRVKEIVKNITL